MMISIVLSGTFVIEPIKYPFIFWSKSFPITFNFSFAPYNQLFQQLLDSDSMISKNAKGINVILIRGIDLDYKKENTQLFIETLMQHMRINHSRFILCICPDNKNSNESFLFEQKLISSLNEINGLQIVKSSELFSLCPFEKFYDDYCLNLGHIPYTLKAYSAIGTLICRKIYPHLHSPYKVIVLDCDNTLWRGVCGEEGLNIIVSPAYKALQAFILKQQKAGMLLCICSKNNENDVFHIFKNHPDMLLTWEKITAYKINWQPKFENIKALSEELYLGLDSFIFIDDNPIECAEVKSCCPEVLTLQLPNDEKAIPTFLENIWVFDRYSLTEADLKRAESYKENAKRENIRKKCLSMADFISELCLDINITEMNENDIPRVSLLTMRTNQFNFTTIRRSESELHALKNDGFIIAVVNVNDKFGAYGLVGVMIYKIENQSFIVDTFLLSCRILGRGVEYHMIAFLAKYALTKNIEYLQLSYKKSSKNIPAKNFLSTLTNEVIPDKESTIYFNLNTRKISQQIFDPKKYIAPEPLTKGSDIQKDTKENNIDLIHEFVDKTLNLTTADAIQKAIQDKLQIDRSHLTIEYIPPENALQQKLVLTWESILNIVPIGIKDSFIALGGDSLKAIHLISIISKDFKIILSPTDLFIESTVQKLAVLIEKKKQKFSYSSPDIFPIDQKSTLIPLSFAQESLWFFEQMHKEKPIYNVSVAFRLVGYLKIDIFQKSLNLLFEKHDILRSNILINSSGSPIQVFSKSLLFPFEYIDLRNKEINLEQIINKETYKPFDSTNDLLICGKLYQTNSEEFVFLLTMDHLITDESSLSLFFQELSETYCSLLEKKVEVKEKPILQYSDFSYWQRQKINGPLLDRQLHYWKNQLSEVPTLNNIQKDLTRAFPLSLKITTYSHRISKNTLEALKKIAVNQNTTLFVVLLAAFQTFLHRFTEEDDILVGSPITNRNHLNLSNMLGLFVNILPLRSNFTIHRTFIQILENTRKTVIEAFQNQDAPFNKIVDTLRLERSGNYHPLVQIIFFLRNQIETFKIKSLKIERLKIQPHFSPFDLSLIAEVDLDGLMLQFEYADIFEEKLIKRMATYFENLLVGIIKEPHCMIGDLPLISKEEIELQIVTWNQTETKCTLNKTINTLFKEQVEKTPEAISVEFGNTKLTYKELYRRANQIATTLKSFGVKKNSIIAICLPRTLDFLSSILGVLKLSCTFILLDANYPEKYLHAVLEDTKAALLILHPETEKKFSEYAGKIPLYNIVEIEDIFITDIHIEETSTPNDIAYIIYTSGSTGHPKGVMIKHDSVCNMVESLSKIFQIGKNSKVLQFSSHGFDSIIAESLVSLLSGGTLVLMSYEECLNPKKFEQIIDKYQITTAILPPSFLLTTLNIINLRSLKTLIVAGEANNIKIVNKWKNEVRLLNAYGPTEATVCSSVYEYIDSVDVPATVIGKPIANTKIYILDKYKKPIPIGFKGELYIGGKGIAQGYLGRPDLTSSVFIPNPFQEHSSEMLYKTGDLGRYLLDGNIEYLGRKDNQVKFHGHRIELQHIEMSLLKLKEVKEAVVLPINNDTVQLQAYITLKEHHYHEEDILKKIRDDLTKLLPSFMIPNIFLIIEKMPLLPSGKIDRSNLPKMSAPLSTKNSHFPPRCILETDLIKIWEEILNRKNIGIFDNFFNLGGSSLQIVQLISKLHKQLQKTIDITEFYSNPTIDGISQLINFDQDKKVIKNLLQIHARGDGLPLILIHPSTGLSLPYLSLQNHFCGRPIYGINNPYFGLNRFSCLKEMALCYIDIINQNFPKGSYYLGGWSFGGTVAFEMAHQLKALGKDVEAVILIDSYPTGDQEHGDSLIIEKIFKSKSYNRLLNSKTSLLCEMQNNFELIRNYQPSRYEGRVILLKAKSEDKKNICNGWRTYVNSEFEIHPLPGDHVKLFDPEDVVNIIKYFTKLLSK